jgi:hypothetical protein
MVHEHRVQVVLGEAERTDGLLRFVLEGEGFDVVGLASNDDELLRVVAGARPEVLVLDAGISAPAAAEARKRADGAALVVVWPDGVAAVLAEERVDPFDSISDLGDAVRRAAKRAEPRQSSVRVPGGPGPTPIVESGRAGVRTGASRASSRPTTTPARSRGRRGQLVIAATTWILALTALTAIGIALPEAMDPSPRHGGGRPSPGVSASREPEPDERTAPERNGDTARRCDAQTAPNDRTDRSRDTAASAPVGARGCPQGRGQGDSANKGKGESGGRPDDPGSQADGRGSSDREPPAGIGGNDGSQGSGGEGQGYGNAGKPADAGNTEKAQEGGLAGNDGRSENGNSG